MNRIRLLLIAAAGVPLVVLAQSAPAVAVADAQAIVAPPPYHSAFDGYLPFVEPGISPDKGWLQANRALVDTLAPDARAPLDQAMPSQKTPHGGADAKRAAVPGRGHHRHQKGH